MALTPEQRNARLTERINRNREEIKRLERQKAQTKRAERNHRLIVSAAAIEAEARRRGMEGFEIVEEKATEMARVYFDKLDMLERTKARSKPAPARGASPE